MKLGIMQPYFIPYLGHFSLINSVDKWVVFDLSQHKPKSWMTRNRLLHPNNGFSFVSVPLKNNSINYPVKDVHVSDILEFKKSFFGKLSVYKFFKAPHYSDVVSVVDDAFNNLSGNSLVDLNVAFISSICNYLSIHFNFIFSSELDFRRDSILESDDWALEMTKCIGADIYINPISGRNIFDVNKYLDNGIRISFLECHPMRYHQGNISFVENLSIIDVMMWNSKEKIIEHINNPLLNVVY